LQTVSRAINNKGEISEDTRRRVLETSRRLGYRPSMLARGLVTRTTLTLGLVVPDIANPFFSEIARGAEDAAHAAGYSLLLGNFIENPEREADVLRTLEEKCVDGIVLCGSRLSQLELAELMDRLPALVLINRPAPNNNAGVITVDDEAGAVEGTRHLLRGGRHAVGFLAGPRGSHSAQKRTCGYTRALAEVDIPYDATRSIPCQPDFEGGREAMQALLAAHPETDAVFCYNDLVAVGALQACLAAGRRVPEDVAVVGCDDILLAALVTPALTTLGVDKREVGAAATRLLLERIKGCTAECQEVIFKPALIVRTSAP
jgi:LacI family transcriptional regulator